MNDAMPAILPATCEEGAVTVQGQHIEAQILSDGVGASEGLVAINADKAFYVTSSAQDLKQALETIASALSSTASMLSTINGALEWNPDSGANAVIVAANEIVISGVSGAASTLNTLKDNLQ